MELILLGVVLIFLVPASIISDLIEALFVSL